MAGTMPTPAAGDRRRRAQWQELTRSECFELLATEHLGRVAVVGCGSGVVESLAGKLVTVDGNVGEVRDGTLQLTTWSENDTPELRDLAEIARRLSPLRGHASGDYPRADSDAAVRVALARGDTDVVSASPLITMLTALRLSEET